MNVEEAWHFFILEIQINKYLELASKTRKNIRKSSISRCRKSFLSKDTMDKKRG